MDNNPVTIKKYYCKTSQSGQHEFQTMDFNSGWKFTKTDVHEASFTDFNDNKWASVNLPHDWSIERLL